MCRGGMMEVLFMHKNKNIPNIFINIFTINTTLSHEQHFLQTRHRTKSCQFSMF